MTSISTKQFQSDIQGVQEAALAGPVIVFDGEKPQYVVLTYEYFDELRPKTWNLADALAMPPSAGAAADFEFAPLDLYLDVPDLG